MLIGFYLRSETLLPSIEGHLHFTLEHREYTFVRFMHYWENKDPNNISTIARTCVSIGMMVSPMESVEPGDSVSSCSKYCLYLACGCHILISRYIMASCPHIRLHRVVISLSHPLRRQSTSGSSLTVCALGWVEARQNVQNTATSSKILESYPLALWATSTALCV